MMRTIYIILLSFSIGIDTLFAQVDFLGFQENECRLIDNHGFTFVNNAFWCGVQWNGYIIYDNGDTAYSYCGDQSVRELRFTDSQLLFMNYVNPSGSNVTRSMDRGRSWTHLGSGAEHMDFFILNQHSVYIASYNPTVGYEEILIARASDTLANRWMWTGPINSDTTVFDTIVGAPYCPIDSLSFQIGFNGNIYTYTIKWHTIPAVIDDPVIPDKFNVYPVPATSQITVDFPAITQDKARIIIRDLSGKTWMDQEASNWPRIDIGHLSGGFYLLTVIQGDDIYHTKFVKQQRTRK